jgi:hypothetical protein
MHANNFFSPNAQILIYPSSSLSPSLSMEFQARDSSPSAIANIYAGISSSTWRLLWRLKSLTMRLAAESSLWLSSKTVRGCRLTTLWTVEVMLDLILLYGEKRKGS